MIRKLAWPLMAAAVIAVPLAIFIPTHAGAIVQPGASYQMYGTSCGNSPCGLRVTITSNPNNAAVRALLDCADGAQTVGGWHTAVGETSATGICNAGAHVGWEQWNMTQGYLAACYIRPDPWNGNC